MMSSPQMRKAAAHSPKSTAALLGYQARLSEPSQCATGYEPVEALQREYAALGYTLFHLNGQELVLSGPGVPSRAMPDARCARVYLRQLTGAT